MTAQTIIPAAHVADLWQSMHELASLGHYGHSAGVIEPRKVLIVTAGGMFGWANGSEYEVTTGQPLVIAG